MVNISLLTFLYFNTNLYLLILALKGGTMTATAIAVKINDKIKERLKALSKIKKRSAHWMMCEAIHQYVDREEKLESFRRDAVNAWEEYQRTDLHVTGDEIVDWLNTWGTDNEKDAPKCHQ